MKLPFQKLVGAGNDFIFFEYSSSLASQDFSKLSQKLCDRQFGIGADGIVAMEVLDLDQKHFKWHFYNSDGSSAEMCGNAARCSVKYIKNTYNKEQMKLETLCGLVEGQFSNQEVEVTWSLENPELKEMEFMLGNRKIKGHFINSGVPHFVMTNIGPGFHHDDFLGIQAHPQFGPDNTNVTLLDIDGETNRTKTFERGVKGFTLACGTGVIASAFVLQNLKPQDVYKLRAPGGNLSVKIHGHEVKLIGPAEWVYSGEIELG